MYSRAKYTRSSSKNISSENYNSKTLRTLDCQKTVYNNDQYAKSMSVDSSVRTGRRVYNTIINNVNNSRKTLPITSFIELSLQTIYEYMQPNSFVGFLSVSNVNDFYEFSCNSEYFYVVNNILYTKKIFNYDKKNRYSVTIYASRCKKGKTCETINRNFVIDILNAKKIQRVLSICNISYDKSDLLSYLNQDERNNIKILEVIEWNNFFKHSPVKKDYIVDTSFINENEQQYKIMINTVYYDEDNKKQIISKIFDKRTLNTLVIDGEFIEGQQLSANLYDGSNMKYNKYNKYFWWVINTDKNLETYKIINIINSKYFTLTQEHVGKSIFASLIYRNDDTIVIKNISNISEKIKGIDTLPTGNVKIVGIPNVGQVLNAYDNISDLDGITTKTLTWYKSRKDLGHVTDAIYIWEISKDGTTWNSIEYSNNSTFEIPIDNKYIDSFLRIKATVYDIYGNSTLFISPSSDKIKNISYDLTVNDNGDTISYKKKYEKPRKYILSGDAIIGEKLIVNNNESYLKDTEDNNFSELGGVFPGEGVEMLIPSEIPTLNYFWYRSYNKIDWNEILNIKEESTFVIPATEEQLYLKKYIKVEVVEKYINKPLKKYETNISDVIESYKIFKYGTATVSGKSIEDSILTLILNMNDSVNLNDYVIQYYWEYSRDTILWNTMIATTTYSLEEKDKKLDYVRTEENQNLIISLDNKSMKIPSNGSFIGTYIRCKILFEKDGITEYLLSNTTSKVENKDQPAQGELIIEGNSNIGSSINAKFNNIMDPDGIIRTISYQWQYGNTSQWTNIGSNNSIFDIPYDESLIGKQIRVIATTIDELGGSTKLYSKNLYSITNYDIDDGEYKVIITGNTIEGSTLQVIIDDSLDKTKIINYVWKFSYDKVTFYTFLDLNENSKYDRFSIPNDNTYIGKYIRVDIIYEKNTEETLLYSSQLTKKISYLNNKTEGSLSILGNPLIGNKMNSSFDGLFDSDNIVVDEFNQPYRNKTLELDDSTKDFRYKVSISYYDKGGTYNLIYSEYTPFITDEMEEFEIPDDPCYYTNEEIVETDFYDKLNECKFVIIGLGASLILTEDFVLNGGQKVLVDGGTLTMYNCNFEILNYGVLIIQNEGVFNIYGNLIVNEKSTYLTTEDMFSVIDYEIISDDFSKKCRINHKINENMFMTILNKCEKVNIVENGHVILRNTLVISNNKTIIINKDGILQILNCNLIIEDTSTLIVYGLLEFTGTLTISENANFVVDTFGTFVSDSVQINNIIITETITIEQLNEYFEKNFEIIIGENGKIVDDNKTLTINNTNSLIISEKGIVDLEDTKIQIKQSGNLTINGTFNLAGGEIIFDNNSTVIFSETSIVNITF